MSTSIHNRSITLGDDIDYAGRRLEGLAFHFERAAPVTDDGRTRYLEEFARACADRNLSHRKDPFPVGVLHPWSPGARTSPVPVGAVTFEPSAEGLVFRATMASGAAAEDALELVKLGAMRDVSVSYRALRSSKRPSPAGIVTTRVEIALRELSLAPTGMGQHPGAEVLAVRSTPTEDHEPGTPRLDALRRRRSLLL
jgi:HK97 family phage prohead protease